MDEWRGREILVAATAPWLAGPAGAQAGARGLRRPTKWVGGGWVGGGWVGGRVGGEGGGEEGRGEGFGGLGGLGGVAAYGGHFRYFKCCNLLLVGYWLLGSWCAK